MRVIMYSRLRRAAIPQPQLDISLDTYPLTYEKLPSDSKLNRLKNGRKKK